MGKDPRAIRARTIRCTGIKNGGSFTVIMGTTAIYPYTSSVGNTCGMHGKRCRIGSKNNSCCLRTAPARRLKQGFQPSPLAGEGARRRREGAPSAGGEGGLGRIHPDKNRRNVCATRGAEKEGGRGHRSTRYPQQEVCRFRPVSPCGAAALSAVFRPLVSLRHGTAQNPDQPPQSWRRINPRMTW